MVKNRHLLALLSVIFFLTIFLGIATAWTGSYHIEREWVKIWINQDGSIELFYNIAITHDLGDNITRIFVGQPKGDFMIINATDQNGNTLTATPQIQEGDYKVQVNLASPLVAGQSIWFTLTTNVAHMVYEDTMNPGNVGILFTPTWWLEANVLDLRVMVVLPPGVNVSMVKTSVDWSNTFLEGDSLAIYWEKQNLAKNEKFTIGVSFPKEYVQYDAQPSGLIAFFQQYGAIFLTFGFFIAVAGVIIYAVSKKAYLMPKINMETLGIRRGLTAVEASYLLDMPPTKIVTEILYSLLQKRAVWVESTNPSLKLKIMQPFQNKTGTVETPLRYYEIDFLHAVKDDGTLDEQRLAETVMFLRETVEQKMRGYCRRDTINYYRKIVAKAWEQVEQAGTPELASKAYDEQLLWLLLDPEYQSRTQTTFRDRAFEPSPFWLWYWYSYRHYYPNPTYKPNVENPAQSAKPPVIPGIDFANNIATAVEKTSNNIVANIEKFANAILPMPAKSSTEPAHHGASCVCACAACACVCACVSCACACAGGGVG